jgi:membrane-associated protease RseP (regulator of RpoE activity)
MRWWPIRARRLPPPPPPDEMLVIEDRLRRNVEGVLAIRDRQVRGGMVVFHGDLMTEPSRALDLLIARFRPLGYTPYLREEPGGVAVQAWPASETAPPGRVGVNVVLFALTLVSTLFAGLSFVGSPTFDALRSDRSMAFLAGAPFALTLLAILGVHELGHYFTARHYRASVSLPYFIPAPFLFGTLGAIILLRSPARDRNALFDIAAAGPLAGLAVALPAALLGFAWSSVVPAPEHGYMAFGDSLLTWGLSYLRFGHIPQGYMLFTHPMADAAWAGFLVTALNLFPVGQLDGGRIAYALFGRHHRKIGKATVVGLLILGATSFFWTLRIPGADIVSALASSMNWFVWAGLISLLVGFHHSPPLDDLSPISPGRRVVGIACLILMVVLIPPPISPLVSFH